MSDSRLEDDAPSARLDLFSSLIWIVLGAAISVGAWQMDRLAHLHINQYEIPGLVPGLLGFAVAVLGGMLMLRALRQRRDAVPPAPGRVPGLTAANAGLAAETGSPDNSGKGIWLVLGLMLFYALALVGRGLPFWLATLIFVSTFIFIFDRDRQNALGRSTAKRLLLALVYGAASSAVVSLAFEHIFLVRLP